MTIHNPTTMLGEDSATGDSSPVKVTNESAHFTSRGGNMGARGTLVTYPVTATATGGDAAGEFITSAVGWRSVTVDVDLASITAGESILVGFSYISDDEVAVEAALDSFRTLVGTPNGTGLAQVFAITSGTPEAKTIYWDDINEVTIKTVCVARDAGADATVLLETVQ